MWRLWVPTQHQKQSKTNHFPFCAKTGPGQAGHQHSEERWRVLDYPRGLYSLQFPLLDEAYLTCGHSSICVSGAGPAPRFPKPCASAASTEACGPGLTRWWYSNTGLQQLYCQDLSIFSNYCSESLCIFPSTSLNSLKSITAYLTLLQSFCSLCMCVWLPFNI